MTPYQFEALLEDLCPLILVCRGCSPHLHYITYWGTYTLIFWAVLSPLEYLQSNLDISKLIGLFFTSLNYTKCKLICSPGNLDL